LRAPETLFDNLQKQAVDQVTKKPYTFSPAKFLHPFTLQHGTLVSSVGAKQRNAKDPMSYGVVGSITNVEVSFDTDTVKLTDPVASVFNSRLNVVSWNVLGNLDQVDHFLILKQVNGLRSIIGKCHSIFPNNSCQYLHPITSHDAGAIQYVVVPIMSDYQLGQEIVTNTLQIATQ